VSIYGHYRSELIVLRLWNGSEVAQVGLVGEEAQVGHRGLLVREYLFHDVEPVYQVVEALRVSDVIC